MDLVIADKNVCKQEKINTLIDLLQYQSNKYADNPLYVYLKNGEDESGILTYAMLNTKVMAVAAEIQKYASTGERALLLFSGGLDFIIGFFACLYSGVIAVPTHMPLSKRADQSHLQSIVKDANISLIISADADFSKFSALPDTGEWFKSYNLVFIDGIFEESELPWKQPNISGDSIAFLQYTSGSTGSPKGVMVTHANLLHNEELIKNAFDNKEGSTIVSWLPLFHDMGLIGNVIHALYIGARLILMPPAAFLQKPVRWLNAINKYRAETSGGPNFAYELCASKVSPEQKQDLDLSCWTNAFNGAERVNAATLEDFYNAFKISGFKKESFYPTYGLAEGTLFATGGIRENRPEMIKVDRHFLELGLVKTSADKMAECLVSSGKSWEQQELLIVNHETQKCCKDMVIGEIWLKGPSVTKGYWKNKEKTQESFKAYLDNGDGPFFRTGDLGFLKNGNLYVTGRLKDLIIIRGKNIYPEDLEIKVQKSNVLFQNSFSAAFSAQVNNQEEVVILQEVDRRMMKSLDVTAVTKDVRNTLICMFQININDVVLLPPGSIPRTSSGKVRRKTAKTHYESGKFEQFRLGNNNHIFSGVSI